MRRTVLMALAVMAVSCSGQQNASSYVWNDLDEATGTRLNLTQGPMPAGQTFTGVYRSPQIGEIQIVQTGDAIVGQYEYDRGSCHVRARIEGSASGNLLRFSWREDHRPCGRIQPVIGRGFFIYHTEQTDAITRGRLFGRWGYQNDDHSGGNWIGFKELNRQPSLTPEAGDGGAAPAEGAGSDTSGSGGSTAGALQGL